MNHRSDFVPLAASLPTPAIYRLLDPRLARFLTNPSTPVLFFYFDDQEPFSPRRREIGRSSAVVSSGDRTSSKLA